jgi:hypothetical protein
MDLPEVKCSGCKIVPHSDLRESTASRRITSCNWIGMDIFWLLHDDIAGDDGSERSMKKKKEKEKKKKALDDSRNRRRYWELKEEAEDRKRWTRQSINRK